MTTMARRDTSLCELLIDFYMVTSAFEKEYARFKEKGEFAFPVMDAMEVDLFHLKNATHGIFREDTHDHEGGVNAEDLFDLVIGSIFHEALHLKEYIYTLVTYESRYRLFEKQAGSRKLAEHERDFLRYGKEIVREARENMPVKADEVRDLFRDATRQMEVILAQHRGNERVIRVLYVERELLELIYGENGLARVYEMIFPGGALEGYARAGSSFHKSGFYNEAAEAYALALEHGAHVSKTQRRRWFGEMRKRADAMTRKKQGGAGARSVLRKVKRLLDAEPGKG